MPGQARHDRTNMRIIVGLGNPGEQYKNTRHNAGFMAADALALKLGLNWEFNKKFKAEITKNNCAILVKPQTFMNSSGQAASAVLSYYKLLPKKLGLFKAAKADLAEVLTVIHDDLDIDLGKYKISVDARSAGHQGVESIINQLKTKNFKRLRIGIRAPAAEKIPADRYVLQEFNSGEEMIIQEVITRLLKEAGRNS